MSDGDAANQLRRLQRFTADLDSATSPAGLGELLFARARRTLGAGAGALFEVHDDALRVVASFGYPDEAVQAWRDVPLASPLPACAAARTGEPVVIETHAEYAERFPMASSIAAAEEGSLVAIPTTSAERAEGVLGSRFPNERRFDPGDIELMVAAAQQFALARRRLELLGAERAARSEAERAQDQLAFLARASHAIATSLDYEQTLATVARMAVPDLADWCAVDLLDDDGTIRQLAVAHVDPDKVTLAIELRRRYPPEPDAPHGVPAAIRSGRSELLEEIPRELLERAVEGKPELRTLLDELQLRSSMVVPLMLGGESIGAITFVMAESERRYTPLDLQLAEELAARAAIAIGNAKLYEAEHRARIDAEAARRRTQVLVTLGEVLTSSPELRSAAESFARFMADEVVDAATVCLFDRDGRAALTVSARAGDDQVWNGAALGIEGVDVDVSEEPVTRALLDREATVGYAPDDAWLPRWWAMTSRGGPRSSRRSGRASACSVSSSPDGSPPPPRSPPTSAQRSRTSPTELRRPSTTPGSTASNDSSPTHCSRACCLRPRPTYPGTNSPSRTVQRAMVRRSAATSTTSSRSTDRGCSWSVTSAGRAPRLRR